MGMVLFAGTLITILAALVFALVLVFRSPLKPFVRNTLIALFIVEALLAGLHTLTWSESAPPFWRWFLNMNTEFTLGTIFSSAQLVGVGMVSLLNGFFMRGRWWERLYWWLLALILVFFAFDEFYSIHEYLGSNQQTDNWRIPYAIGGIIFVSVSSLMYWFGAGGQRGSERRKRFALLFIGLLIMAGGGIAMEAVTWNAFTQQSTIAQRLSVLEETFEMVGATLVLAALLLFAQSEETLRGWRVTRPVLWASIGAWTLWLLFVVFLQPGVEARSARDGYTEYGMGAMSLIGYEVDERAAIPGGQIPVTFYWQANEPLTTDFSLSVHLLAHPDIQSVSQADELHAGPYPSSGWIPGIIVRRTVFVPVPADIPTPASYWLMVRVWSGPWPQDRDWSVTEGLVISGSDLPTIAEDALIIDSVPIVSAGTPESPPQSANYRFEGGFTLSGYALADSAEAGAALPVDFWWHTQTEINVDLTQYVHLVDDGGTMVAGFDQQPFAGRFPTVDWPANLSVRDAWQVPLPADLPAGEYRVYTGMYAPVTVIRQPVTDGVGTPIQDNSIYLGMVEVTGEVSQGD
ncbi:MAG: hypothetical protein H7175_11190 [Burkholderiales bacterium]|nr:hypothetical protein [Anaerolineae bacterium]